MALPFLYKYITTGTTTNITTSPTLLHAITVNGALTGTITIKDGATTIGVITNPGVGAVFFYDIGVSSLSIVTSAACDIVVSYFPT